MEFNIPIRLILSILLFYIFAHFGLLDYLWDDDK